MLNRMPSTPPALSSLLPDIFHPTPAQLARAFHVSTATARRWITTDQAPRAVLLALWWLTGEGQATVDAEAVNAARMHATHAAVLSEELEDTRRQLARLAALLASRPGEAANDAAPYRLNIPGTMRSLTDAGSALRTAQARTVTAS